MAEARVTLRPSRARIAAIRAAAAAICLGLWEAMAASGLFYEGIVPSLALVAEATLDEIHDPEFYRHLGLTTLAAVVGFLAGGVLAVAVGTYLGLHPYLRRAVEPYLAAIGGTPKIIFLPILFLIFGLGIESKMAKGALSAFFPIVFSAMLGVITINPILIRVGRSFHLTRRQMFAKIYVPSMLGPLMTGARLGLAMSLIGILAAEIKYSDGGLGFRLIKYADHFKIASMYAMVILIFLLVALVNGVITRLQERALRHHAAGAGSSAQSIGMVTTN